MSRPRGLGPIEFHPALFFRTGLATRLCVLDLRPMREGLCVDSHRPTTYAWTATSMWTDAWPMQPMCVDSHTARMCVDSHTASLNDHMLAITGRSYAMRESRDKLVRCVDSHTMRCEPMMRGQPHRGRPAMRGQPHGELERPHARDHRPFVCDARTERQARSFGRVNRSHPAVPRGLPQSTERKFGAGRLQALEPPTSGG